MYAIYNEISLTHGICTGHQARPKGKQQQVRNLPSLRVCVILLILLRDGIVPPTTTNSNNYEATRGQLPFLSSAGSLVFQNLDIIIPAACSWWARCLGAPTPHRDLGKTLNTLSFVPRGRTVYAANYHHGDLFSYWRERRIMRALSSCLAYEYPIMFMFCHPTTINFKQSIPGNKTKTKLCYSN